MEKKKILIIKCSPRDNGYTNRLCSEVEKLADDCTVDVFDTYKENFLPCDACNFCEKNGCCAKHDLDVFFEKFEDADYLVIASPVYNGTFPAPFKSLLDRFQVYYTGFYANGKRQCIEKRKKAVFIAASGRCGKTAFEYMKSQLECAFSILNTELENAFLCAYTDTCAEYEQTLGELKRSLNDERTKG